MLFFDQFFLRSKNIYRAVNLERGGKAFLTETGEEVNEGKVDPVLAGSGESL